MIKKNIYLHYSNFTRYKGLNPQNLKLKLCNSFCNMLFFLYVHLYSKNNIPLKIYLCQAQLVTAETLFQRLQALL